MAKRRRSLKFSTLVGLALLLFAVGLVAQNGQIFGLWTTMPSLPQNGGSGVTAHTATLLADGNIFIAGGLSGVRQGILTSEFTSDQTAEAAMYLVNLNQWAQVSSMYIPRAGHGAALLPDGASVLVAGGETSPYVPGTCGFIAANGTTETEVFDETNFGWAHALSMNSPRADFSLLRLLNGRILAAAGSTTDQSAEVYDPSSNTWSYTGGMNAQRAQAAYTLLPDGRVLVAGGDIGYSIAGTAINCPADAEVYDPSTNNWSNAGNMAVNRYGATATVVCVTATVPCPDGSWRVLVAGGFDGNIGSNGNSTTSANFYSNTAELWNPATNSFSPAASMLSARAFHTATLLPNGQVLAAGGYTNFLTSDGSNIGQALSFAEIYDPNTDSWQIARSMNTARANHTATLELGPGPAKLLVAGGEQQQSQSFPLSIPSLASVELFQPTPIASVTSLSPTQTLPGQPVNTQSSCLGGLESAATSTTGIGAPTGFVSIYLDGNPIPVFQSLPLVSDPNGGDFSVAVSNTPLSAGSHSAQAYYAGDGAFSPSFSSFVNLSVIAPPIQVTGPATAFLGDPVTLIASVPAGATSPFNFTWTPPNGTAGASCNIVGCFAGVPPALGPNVFNVTGTDATGCHLGTGTFSVNVVSGHFAVSAPASVKTGVPFTFTVTALDNNNNVVPSYAGTAHFTSSDSLATLPSNYTFTAADGGVHTFTATLVTGGNQTITATDTASASITGTSAAIQVIAPDFAISVPSPINVKVGGSENATVMLTSLNGFNSPVTLSTSTPPAGVTTAFSANPITPPSGGTGSSMLNLSLSPLVTPAIFTLTVQGSSGSLTHSTTATVTVTSSPSGISSVIGQILAAGGIDNSGIANALTSKLAAAQGFINAGDNLDAINALSALLNQIRAQAGKHIATSCTINGQTFNPATLLITDVQSLIDSLRVGSIADPIIGYVMNSAGVGVPGAVVSLSDSNGNTLATATTDITGFYYFATTGVLSSGFNYTIAVTGLPSGFTTSTPSQPFTWQGTGLAFGFSLN